MFCIGCLVMPWLPSLPTLATAWLSVIVACCLWRVIPAMMAGLVGMALVTLAGQDYLAQRLPLSYEGKVLQVDACVADLLAPFNGRYRRIDIDIVSARYDNNALSWQGRAQVGDYKGWPMSAGQCYAMEVKLKRPHSLHNFELTDRGATAVVKGIVAQGYIRHVGEQRPQRLKYGLLRARDRFQAWLLTSPLSPPSQGLMAALLLGDKSLLSLQQWRDSQRTGTVHLLVVSGLHIGLMSLSFFWLGYGAAWLFPHYYHRLSRRQIAWISAWLGGFLFAIISGWGLPAQRAIIMLSVAVWCSLRRQFTSPWYGLAMACSLVLLCQPMATLSLGFWLSFGLVACLLAGTQDGPPWLHLLTMQMRCLVVSTPLLWWQMASISSVAPLINLLLVPCITVLLPLLLILSLGTSVSDVFWSLMAPLLECFQWLMSLASQPDWAWIRTQSLPSLALPALIIGTLLIAAPMWLPMRAIGGVLFMAVALNTSSPQYKPLQMTVFDVGQGSAVLIQSEHHWGLYDTGPRYGDYSAMQHIILPSLHRFGIEGLQQVWVSHSDSDHSGGWPLLQQSLHIQAAALPRNQDCVRGRQWQLGRVAVTALWPPAGDAQRSPNNRSCSLLLEVADRRIFMPGDIEASVEQRLVALGLPNVDVLFVPHHGSKTSSSLAFVRALNPRHVVVESGYRNRYGHPVAGVLARYRDIGAHLWWTASDGAIRLTVDSQGNLGFTTSRRERPAFWH